MACDTSQNQLAKWAWMLFQRFDKSFAAAPQTDDLPPSIAAA
jgi:hypothetical protein